MKNKPLLIPAIIIILAIMIGGFLLTAHVPTRYPSTQIPSRTPQTLFSISSTKNPSTSSNTCKPEHLQALVQFGAAAGNVYGTFTLTNKSTTPCKIIGNNFIEVKYQTNQVKNIVLNPSGTPTNATYQLQPNQTLYAQIHLPNGPQCSSQIQQTTVSFDYKFTAIDKLTFTDKTGNQSFPINICTNPTEMTQIDISPFSDKAINQ